MTAFLFIASTGHAQLAQRVDLANFATLFGDRDEVPPVSRTRRPFARVALAALLVVGAVGDALMVARPDVLGTCLAGSSSAPVGTTRSASF